MALHQEYFLIGFAVGCAARLASPATWVKEIGLRPSFGLWPRTEGKPEPGAKPVFRSGPPARQSLAAHRAAEPLQKEGLGQSKPVSLEAPRMYLKSASAVWTAVRMLFKSWTTLPLLLAIYAALLFAVYFFISTREATVPQLILTFVLMFAAPLLFFLLQAASVNYATGSPGLLQKALRDCLKFIVVSLPVIGLTVLAAYGIGKLQGRLTVDPNTLQPSSPNTMTTLIVVRYLLIGVIAPLVTIQLWIATSTRGLRGVVRSLGQTLAGAFAPQAVLVFAFGFLIFAVAPYFLLAQKISIERSWLEVSLFTARVVVSALLVLVGWVITLGALSILSTQTDEIPNTQTEEAPVTQT
jgi:hypothetical protein